jgi:dTDP-4-dehydrorhamnose reductase
VLREEMTQKTRYFIVGADSRIGGALWERLKAEDADVSGTALDPMGQREFIPLDLDSDPSRWTLPDQSDVAFLCAAITSLEACRKDPAFSRRINVERTAVLAERLSAAGAKVIFLSSDRVFDGTVPFRSAADAVCPTTEYGRQKAEAERRLLALRGRAAIVRFSKVLFPDSPPFADWRRALERCEPIHPFHDMSLAPISADFAVEALRRAADSEQTGIFQVSADREVTYAQAAERLAGRLGAEADLVRSASAKETLAETQMPPRHAALDCSRLKLELGLEPPDVWQAIDMAAGMSRSLELSK